jgi:hypothetical protein
MKSVEITYSFHPNALPPTPLPAKKNLLTMASRLIFLFSGWVLQPVRLELNEAGETCFRSTALYVP